MGIEETLQFRRAAGVLVRLAKTDPGTVRSLAHMFDAEAGSRGAFLSAGAPRRSRSHSQPAVRVFERLGIAYGAVTIDGLQLLRAHPSVKQVVAANSLRLIRPVPPAEGAPKRARPRVGPTWGIQAMRIEALWAEGLSGKGVLIGHLDTGLDGAHPMLEGAIKAATVFDFSGRAAKAHRPITDSDEHGTHTAGILVGRPFKRMQAGVAHGAKLVTAEVIEGGETIARVLGGIEWALEHQAKILNLSLGWSGYVDSFLMVMDAVRAAGCLPVVAIGNEGEGSTRSPGNYAASLSVGAITPDHQVATFSGSEVMLQGEVSKVVPHVVAPGVDIWSAEPGGGVVMRSGTSMATPHVAGLAALLMEACPSATIELVQSAILAAAELRNAMPEQRAGRGVPDAINALNWLRHHVPS